MASGPIAAAGDGVSKTKHKWSDGGNKSQKRSKPTTAARQESSNSLGSEYNSHQKMMMEISLSSISKLEVRNLKRKLMAELEEVRRLINQLKPRANIAGDFAPVSNKKPKTANGGKKGGGHRAAADKGLVQILKKCDNLLMKLMKHKSGWIFSTPVDAAKLGLHDYHTIVKKPMDLGTVKTRLSKSLYVSPSDFAEDVRLTFNNAILYNPKEHEVHRMAEFLLNMFEEKWAPLETQYDFLNRRQQPTRDIDLHAPVTSNSPYVQALPLPASTLSPPPPSVVENRTLERAKSMTTPVEPEVLTVVPEKPEEEEGSENRDLTFDEKHRLSEDLQDLPFDKLEAVVQIIKKWNPELAQHDDDIELDIDSLDLKTLWELYRFVTQCKEGSSTEKKKQGMCSERDAESVHNSVQEPNTPIAGHVSSKVTIHVASPDRQEVNAGGSSSSNSSSSGSGSCSNESDSDS